MSDDLIKRIREGYNNWDSGYKADGALLGEAADLIEQQAAKIAKLEARIAANGGEPVACWAAYNGVCLQAFFKSKQAAESYAAEMQKNHDLSGSLAAFTVKPLYAAPVASGPRYDTSAIDEDDL